MQQHDVVSVIAGGWSFSEVDHEKVPGTIIAINEAALALRRPPDYVVTMDRLWTENRWKQLCHMRWPTYVRREALQNVPRPLPLWVLKFECDHNSARMVDESGHLNGLNSGQCGINLAYKMRPRRVYLFGFDMMRGPRGEQHWHVDYDWEKQRGGHTTEAALQHWSQQFYQIEQQFAAIGTGVINVTSRSAIKVFPRLTPATAGMAAQVPA